MSIDFSAERDERTMAVENTSYKWAYTFLTYALLIDVIYRGWVRDEATWDLLALVIVGGAVSAVYQARHKTLPRFWANKATLIGCVAGMIMGVVAAIVLSWARG